MSIRGRISTLVAKGELYCLESEMLGDETVRTLFVSKAVFDAVRLPFPQDQEVLHAEFRQTLDAFLEGGQMTVGSDPTTKASDALMARVAPIEDEFFDFRITSPYPQIRAFGAFAERDVFVLVTWDYRHNIGENFDEEVRNAKREWQRLFGDTQPHAGRALNDYLSNSIAV